FHPVAAQTKQSLRHRADPNVSGRVLRNRANLEKGLSFVQPMKSKLAARFRRPASLAAGPPTHRTWRRTNPNLPGSVFKQSQHRRHPGDSLETSPPGPIQSPRRAAPHIRAPVHHHRVNDVVVQTFPRSKMCERLPAVLEQSSAIRPDPNAAV